MRIFILTLGTRGDLDLFLGLGREMRARGHDLVFGTSGFYAPQVAEARLPFVRIGDGDWTRFQAVLRASAVVRDRTERTYAFFKEWLAPQLAAAQGQIGAVGARADYFVSNLKMVLRKGPHILPGAAVTYDPPGSLADLAKYGSQQHGGRVLELVAMNKRLVDPWNQWGATYRFTGFWRDERAPKAEPTPALAAFLAAGLPPVVLTLGSLPPANPDQVVEVFSAGLRRVGRRGVVVAGWSSVRQAAPTDELCFVPEAPYDWLFPRSCCVLHHGGCGTTAAVLYAGVPSVVLPQLTCQELFGRLLERAGLAAGVLDANCLTPGELTDSMARAINQRRMSQAVQACQQELLGEQGLRSAADALEGHYRTLNSVTTYQALVTPEAT